MEQFDEIPRPCKKPRSDTQEESRERNARIRGERPLSVIGMHLKTLKQLSTLVLCQNVLSRATLLIKSWVRMFVPRF